MDYYIILGVERSATEREIKKAWVTFSHPNVFHFQSGYLWLVEIKQGKLGIFAGKVTVREESDM